MRLTTVSHVVVMFRVTGAFPALQLMPLCLMQGKRYPLYTFVLINTVIFIHVKVREPNIKLRAIQFLINGRNYILLCPCSMTGRYAVHVLVVLPVFLDIRTFGVKIIVNAGAGNLFCRTSYFKMTVHLTNTDITVFYLFLVSLNKSITLILI